MVAAGAASSGTAHASWSETPSMTSVADGAISLAAPSPHGLFVGGPVSNVGGTPGRPRLPPPPPPPPNNKKRTHPRGVMGWGGGGPPPPAHPPAERVAGTSAGRSP